MLNDPLAGRGFRVPERSRMLVATEDGVFLWPGTPLVYRQGNGFVAAEPREINSAIGSLFGPAAIYAPVQTVLERARDELRNGRVAAVQAMLDRLRLPASSSNGARLIRAIAQRQDLSPPGFAEATAPSGTIWSTDDVAFFARLYDGRHSRARMLEKIFNPGAAWDPAQHPRWPRGESDGGEFAPAEGGEAGSILPAAAQKPPWFTGTKPPLGDPPKIPEKQPKTKAAQYAVIRSVAYWLAEATLLGADAPIAATAATVMGMAEAISWLAPYVTSYFEPPKTLGELQAAVENPQPGTNTHHIVEQTSAEKDGFPRSMIDDPDNLVQIPEIKHWQLNGWFSTPNATYGGLTPRQYVKNKDWETRRQVGLEGLREIGVLKP